MVTLEELSRAEVLGEHSHERTWRHGEWVTKAIRFPGPEAEPRIPHVFGVVRWLHLRRVSRAACMRLSLPEGDWVLATRRWVPGRTLAHLDPNEHSWASRALSLAFRMRDLHEVGLVHGDIQPRNVIVDDAQTLWLIDVGLFGTRPDQRGHVAGSAPLMAPELWEGEPPSPAADLYALGSLVCWMACGRYPHAADGLSGWAEAHREGTPRLDGLSPELAGVVGRMVARDPRERPGVQELIDVLRRQGARAEEAPIAFATPPVIAQAIDEIVQVVSDGQGASVVVEAARGCGKSTLAARIIERLELAGRHAVLLRGAKVERPPPRARSEWTPGPWDPVFDLLDALARLAEREPPRPSLGHGDRVHAFTQLTDAVLEVLPPEGAVVVWDDFDALGPDVRQWWNHLSNRLNADASATGPRLASVLTTTEELAGELGVRRALSPFDVSYWNRWRARTLRVELRDIAQRRWERLVEEHGARIGAMLAALEDELGVRGRPGEKDAGRAFGVPDVAADDWRTYTADLMRECAFGEVIETCRALRRDLIAGRSVPAHRDDLEREILEVWAEATIRGGSERVHELEDALREKLTAAPDVGAALVLARVLHALGRHADGLRVLEAFDEPDPDVALWRAQLSISSGRLDDARRFAQAGLALAPEQGSAAFLHLEMLAHAADAIRGRREAIEALRDMVPRLENPQVPPTVRARCHAYRALGLTRNDELDDATDAHLRALEEVETAGLDAELPTYLLNVGTAYHRQGRLGLAREYYARGTRISQPSTRASTRALLLANQANIDLALGRLDEARLLVERAQAIASRHELAAVGVMCRSIAGDILLAQGRHREALEVYRGPLDAEAPLAPHQRAELSLACAEACLLFDDSEAARRWLDEARHVLDEAHLVDLEQFHGILRARLQWAEGGALGTMAGIELFRRSLLGAQEGGNHKLVLRQSPHLLAQLEREGLTELLHEVTELVQRSRNAIAMGLTRELRRDFFANLPPAPPTSPAKEAAPSEPTRASASPAVVERFYRMLSLNEVILHSDDLDALLSEALDIALSLSGAERSFVLLRDTRRSRVGQFRVAASRDVDRAPIPSPHLEVSLTIAEEAARTGRTVATLNAQQDERFNAALSVVDLDLTSVLCVPVRDATGLLGALYLDHRFRPGIFEGEIPRMMEAFGHQLALAITNARRIEELEAERARLAEAEQKLSELLDERELMLEGLRARCAELRDEVDRQRADRSGLRDAFPRIAFTSRAMEQVLDQVHRVARGDIPVVVTGESGVGKELIARAIHDASPRRSGPFIAFNCAAVTESLFESEMFGHVKGAFTGADTDRQGLFVAASGGTIFLDEVGEMPTSMQVKFLRVLQERQVRRVGASTSQPVDVRVVAATNRDLREMVEEGDFREDLFYRLAAFVIAVPPLRERREDIALIAQELLRRIEEESGRSDLGLTPQGARLLSQCDWPGNVRELENTLRAAVVLSDSARLGEEALAPLVRIRGSDAQAAAPRRRAPSTRGRRPKATREDVVEALRRAEDDREAAAAILGVSPRTLYRYLKRWDLY